MTMLMRTAGVTVLGLAVVACGGGGLGGDRAAIRDVFRDVFRAFENEDVEALASLLTADCEDAEALAAEAIDDFLDSSLGGVIKFDITGADIRDLTETTAEAIPQGTSSVDGEEFPLVDSADSEYAGLIKTDGEWKLADCHILF